MNEKIIKEKFKELVKKAGFKSINDFANKTCSHTGNQRSSTGINHHCKNVPYDLRILRGYAKDLKVHLNDVFELFGLKEDYNFIEHLEILGFKKGQDLEMNSLTREDLHIILITNNEGDFDSVAGGRNGEVIFSLPFLPDSKEMTELIIKKSEL